MNTFKFTGNITPINGEYVKHTANGTKQLKFCVKQNENNSAFVQMFTDKLQYGGIPVTFIGSSKQSSIKFEDRKDLNILKDISYSSKYLIQEGNIVKEFIWKDDFIDCFLNLVNRYPANATYEVSGDFSLTNYKGKEYKNFNIKSVKLSNFSRHELVLKLDLYYDYRGLDESDKRNKFILNAFIEQYNVASRDRRFYPIQVQFITNRFDFKNLSHVEIIRHRKANMKPDSNLGYVKATWECQYVRGAQAILPTLETLPKDIQFEIKNAGRDLKEYMQVIVGKADEYICLTRPDNTKSADGSVFTPLKCTKEEFENKIIKKNIISQEETLDKIVSNEAKNNPFN